MKISVIGATGRTGQFLVRQALDQGHVVTALVRNAPKLNIQHPNLKIVETNIFSADDLSEHFQGQDAIFSCLAFRYGIIFAITGYTDSMKAIATAARQAKVKRIIVMTSWYSSPESAQCAPAFVRYFLLPPMRGILTNMHEMETYLKEECSDLDWTVVRPPGLWNSSATDREFLAREGYFIWDYSCLNSETRGDVARFMLSLLGKDEWIQQGVAMCTV